VVHGEAVIAAAEGARVEIVGLAGEAAEVGAIADLRAILDAVAAEADALVLRDLAGVGAAEVAAVVAVGVAGGETEVCAVAFPLRR
jgi:hypothetical protein